MRAGRMAFRKLDVLHRENLDRILPRFGISGLAEDAARNLNLAWHRLPAWPDVPGGLARLKRRFLLAPLSNGNISLMVDLARRNNFPWDAILGAEIAGDYKPKPAGLPRRLRGLRPAARRLHDGRRAYRRSSARSQVRIAHGARRTAERARAGHRRSRSQGAGRGRGD